MARNLIHNTCNKLSLMLSSVVNTIPERCCPSLMQTISRPLLSFLLCLYSQLPLAIVLFFSNFSILGNKELLTKFDGTRFSNAIWHPAPQISCFEDLLFGAITISCSYTCGEGPYCMPCEVLKWCFVSSHAGFCHRLIHPGQMEA